MAKIIINDNITTKGLMTVRRSEDEEGNMLISGMLLTHRYFLDITKLETERYIIDDVYITAEEFASNDFMIKYEFIGEEITIKGGETNLPQEVIDKLEEEYFSSETEELFHEEVYKKWMQETK